MTWPDLVIGFIALLFALKGWKRGFVAEIGGFIALAASIWAAIHYPGTFDALMRDYVHLGGGSAHLVGMVVFALVVYVALMVISSILSRIAKLPVIGLGNGLGGALVGIAKSLVGVWVVLYVMLFFPLSRDIRADLHNSMLVAFVTQENPQIDDFVRGTMPWFVRPLVAPLFARHRV
ncbi:MAG TPA: CvpA family protein [Candidatus Elarobacter sp.]|jgi:membrane protein required for colicin V production